MPEPEFVRVRLPESGAEVSVHPDLAKHHDLKPLDKPASRGGTALPAKHNPLKKTASKGAAARKTSRATSPSTSDPAGTAEKEN